MEQFSALVDQLTTRGANGVPSVSAVVRDRSGKTIFKKTSGFQSLDPDAASVDDKSIFRLSSTTKLFTAIAALQCVERGQIGLDEPVHDYLSELKDKQVISSSFGSHPLDAPTDTSTDSPAFEYTDTKQPITLRQLLTHTSGIGYDVLDPTLQAWRTSRNESPKAMSGYATAMFNAPLIFEPGTSWMYGAGYDAAGVLISRLNDNMGLEAYMRKNIFEPLGLESSTFFIRKKEGAMDRLVQCVTEAPDGKLVPFPDVTGDDAAEEQGSGGMYSTVEDYVTVLVDLLQEEPKLLKKETVDKSLFGPQLEEGSPVMEGFKKASFIWSAFTGVVGDETKINHSLAGLLVERAMPEFGGVSTTLQWGGGTGTFWRIEKERGIAAVYATQIFPPMDKSATLLRETFIAGAKAIGEVNPQ